MYEYEEDTEIIGAHCTLLEPYRGTPKVKLLRTMAFS